MKFQRGTDFPNEGFVQQAVEKYFRAQGFIGDTTTYADLISSHPGSGEKWLVEAKGMTTSPGLDFKTGLGQLLQRMGDERFKYAIAIPNVPGFIKQWNMIPRRVRNLLGLHVLLIEQDGSVRMLKPDENPPAS